jgi:hypothetical protein
VITRLDFGFFAAARGLQCSRAMTCTRIPTIVAAFVALVLGACALVQDEREEPFEIQEVIETLGPELGEIPDLLCACETWECTRRWVLEHVGCDLCVHQSCEDGRRAGACVLCDGESN